MNEARSTLETALESLLRRIVREEIVAVIGNANGHSPTLLSAAQAAKLWDIPKTWISEAARRGEIPTVRLGHYVRFKPEDLEEFIRLNRSSVDK